jgi:hypothetical protein
MTLTNKDLQSIGQAIRLTLESHGQSPFLTLREAGPQAELRDALRRDLSPHTGPLAEPQAGEGRGDKSGGRQATPPPEWHWK